MLDTLSLVVININRFFDELKRRKNSYNGYETTIACLPSGSQTGPQPIWRCCKFLRAGRVLSSRAKAYRASPEAGTTSSLRLLSRMKPLVVAHWAVPSKVILPLPKATPPNWDRARLHLRPECWRFELSMLASAPLSLGPYRA